MYFLLKKSKLIYWWVAKRNSKLNFVNICSKEEITEDLVVVGFMKDSYKYSYPELAMSQNRVVKVTKKGVITSKGSFYPFEEAHALYIDFLNNANKTKTVIAFNWKLAGNTMTADIIQNGNITEGITFDFEPYHENLNDIGYSDKLKSDVVVSLFSRRGACMSMNIPSKIKSDMILYAEFECENGEYIKCVRSFVK